MYCCSAYNAYRHPRPEPKRHRFLDTVKVEKFTVNRVGESCIEKCCEPMPVGISVKNSVLILSGVTHCIEPDVYYTFDIDRYAIVPADDIQGELNSAEKYYGKYKETGDENYKRMAWDELSHADYLISLSMRDEPSREEMEVLQNYRAEYERLSHSIA